MRKLFVLLFIVFLLPFSARATRQEPDRILYKGKLLLTSATGDGYPIVTDSIYKFIKSNTGCVKGYVPTWELRNDSLFLVKVCDCNFEEIPLSVLYPRRDTSSGVFASWFTHELLACRANWVPVFSAKLKEGKIEKFKEFMEIPFPMDFSGIWRGEDSLWQIKLDLQWSEKEELAGTYRACRKNKDEASSGTEHFIYPVHGKNQFEKINLFIYTDSIKNKVVWGTLSPIGKGRLKFKLISSDPSISGIPKECRLER